MPKSNDKLLNEIMARRRALQNAPKQEMLAQVLDDLNVFDTLETLRGRKKLCYGPKIIGGGERISVVIWRRPAGYHGYKVLTLIGVWALLRDEQAQIVVGAKQLGFTAPFYDAEAYDKLIRKNFDLYYADDHQPPVVPTFSTAYDAEKRLDLRETVARSLAGVM